MKNTTDANSQRRRDAGFAALGNAASQNVSCVRARGQVQQNPRCQKQSEIMNPEHAACSYQRTVLAISNKEIICLQESDSLRSLWPARWSVVCILRKGRRKRQIRVREF